MAYETTVPPTAKHKSKRNPNTGNEATKSFNPLNSISMDNIVTVYPPKNFFYRITDGENQFTFLLHSGTP